MNENIKDLIKTHVTVRFSKNKRQFPKKEVFGTISS